MKKGHDSLIKDMSHLLSYFLYFQFRNQCKALMQVCSLLVIITLSFMMHYQAHGKFVVHSRLKSFKSCVTVVYCFCTSSGRLVALQPGRFLNPLALQKTCYLVVLSNPQFNCNLLLSINLLVTLHFFQYLMQYNSIVLQVVWKEGKE